MLIFFFSLLLTGPVHAETEATANPSQIAQVAPIPKVEPAELQNCKPQGPEFEANALRAAKAAKLTNSEVLARLIYAESLSTGFWKGRCKANSAQDIFTTIGWGIMNRVQKSRSSDPYYATIFAKSQFGTSFYATPAKDNPFSRAFLCPLSAKDYLPKSFSADELFAQAQKTADDIIGEYGESKTIPAGYKGITNFFYPRSEFYGELRPGWAPNTDPTKNKGYLNLMKSENPCVEYYRL